MFGKAKVNIDEYLAVFRRLFEQTVKAKGGIHKWEDVFVDEKQLENAISDALGRHDYVSFSKSFLVKPKPFVSAFILLSFWLILCGMTTLCSYKQLLTAQEFCLPVPPEYCSKKTQRSGAFQSSCLPGLKAEVLDAFLVNVHVVMKSSRIMEEQVVQVL